MWVVVFEVQSNGNFDQVQMSVLADNLLQAKFKAKQELARKFPFPGMLKTSKIIKVVKLK